MCIVVIILYNIILLHTLYIICNTIIISHLLGAYSVPGTVLYALHKLFI